MANVISVGASGNAEIDGLLSGYGWSGIVSYSFPDSPSDYPPGYGSAEPLAPDFAQISTAQQAAAHAAMAQVASFTNLTLQFAGTNGADIRIAQSSEANPTAYAYYPFNDNEGGDIWFGTNYNFRDARLGDYFYHAHLHEAGHALGLKHSQELGGVANVALPADHDALEFTVMSYHSYVGSGIGAYTTYLYPTTYMMNDIRALQEMYGADFTAKSGNTTYSWSPETGECFIDGVGQGRPGGPDGSINTVFMTVWDGGGNDTYDFSNYAFLRLTIDLNPGAYSDSAQRAYLGDGQYAHGTVYNSYLYNGDARSYIENAIGGGADDILIGNAVANVLDGRTGSDTLTGGGGDDTFIFRYGAGESDIITDFIPGARSPDKIDLSALPGLGNFAAVIAAGSQVGADTVLTLGAGDTLTLRDVALASLAADDFILARLGGAPTNIVLAHAAIDENLSGGTIGALSVADPDGNTIFTFALSDDRLTVAGGPGAYLLKLKSGIALDYETETAVNFTATATDQSGLSFSKAFSIAINDLDGVTIRGTENRDIIDGSRTVTGQPRPTPEPDIILAGNGNDTVSGLGGGDEIQGGAGDDTLNGDGGNDWLMGGPGIDRIYGGEGDDVLVIEGIDAIFDKLGGGGGVDTILLGARSVALSKFSATVSSIEILTGNGLSIYGTDGDDALDFSGLIRFDRQSYVDTGAGNDAITGMQLPDDLRGGAGNDVIYANAGADILRGGTGADTLDGGAQDDRFLFGGTEALGDIMRGGTGTDSIEITGSGDVTLSQFNAKAASIEIWKGNGKGVLGTAGDDVLDFSGLAFTSGGLSRVDTGGGNDKLTGTSVHDHLRGGTGNDVLTGGMGDDTLQGGAGADSFVFRPGFGRDRITDFEAGPQVSDVIVMDHAVFGNLAALLAASHQVGADVVIGAGLSNVLTLEHTLLGNLHANDFAFV